MGGWGWCCWRCYEVIRLVFSTTSQLLESLEARQRAVTRWEVSNSAAIGWADHLRLPRTNSVHLRSTSNRPGGCKYTIAVGLFNPPPPPPSLSTPPLQHNMAASLRPTLMRQALAAPAQRTLTSAVLPAFRVQRSQPILKSIPRATFQTSAARSILPPLPQVIKGGVNDPVPTPAPHPSHGSYHWSFERCDTNPGLEEDWDTGRRKNKYN